jgi:two-component system LytT family response regulator
MHVLVVDDDASARQHIRALLAAYDDVMAEECSDGREAVRALTSSRVDLVLLDVEMPQLDGFGVLAEVGAERMPPVIFVSAYSEYAVRAFEAYALDYLLKPFDDARFATALDRGRAQVHARRHANAALDQRLIGILEHLRRPQPAHYPDALAIRSGDQYVVVRVADVDWIEADGNYARLYVRGRARVLTRTLAALESELLDPSVFIRVHRSAIVNASKIASIEPLFHGELSLVLHDGTRVPCSRRHRKRLEERLYFTT